MTEVKLFLFKVQTKNVGLKFFHLTSIIICLNSEVHMHIVKIQAKITELKSGHKLKEN